MKHHPKNRSSPDVDPSRVEDAIGRTSSDPLQQQRKPSETDSLEAEGSKGQSSEGMSSKRLLSASMNSAATLTGGDADSAERDGAEEEGGEGEEVATPLQKSGQFPLPPLSPMSPTSTGSVPSEEAGGTREERAGTLHSDMSGSCSTLQNERPEGDMESSTEQV